MSREILFKGKRKDNGEWIEGYFFKIWDRVFLLWGMTNDNPNMVEVIPETVGQLTELVDKNGKRIFDGDVVQAKQLDSNETVKVIIKIGKYTDFNSGDINIGVYALFNEGVTITINDIVEHQDLFEVIGNVYDDKELLGG